MQVLLEINGLLKVLCVDRDELVFTVENEIGLLGINRVLAYCSCTRRQSSGVNKVYILQR